MQGHVLDRLQPSDFVLTHRWESLNAFAGEVTLSGLRTLMADPEVLMVDEDPIAYMDLAETAALIRVDQVRGAGTTGKGVAVAVLDTGVDARHPDIRDGLAAEQCFCMSASGAGCCPNGATEQSGAGWPKTTTGTAPTSPGSSLRRPHSPASLPTRRWWW